MSLPTGPSVLLRLFADTVATSLVPSRRSTALEPHENALEHEYVVRPGARTGWHWWLQHGDGTQMATAPLPARTREQARAETLRVRLAAATSRVEFFHDERGRVHWRLLSRTGAMLAVSAVGYRSRQAADRAVAAFRREASHAGLHDD